MKVVAIKPLEDRPGEYLLLLDNGEEIVIDEDTLVRRRLLPDREIDEGELEEAARENKRAELRKVALRYLSRSFRSTHEVRRFLENKGYPPRDVDEVIDELTRLGYLDDEALVQNLCHRLVEKGKGRYFVQRELKKRGIDSNLIEQTIEELDGQEEFENCLRLARKKIVFYRKKPHLTRRLYHALLRQGFPHETVLKVLDHLMKEGELDLGE